MTQLITARRDMVAENHIGLPDMHEEAAATQTSDF